MKRVASRCAVACVVSLLAISLAGASESVRVRSAAERVPTPTSDPGAPILGSDVPVDYYRVHSNGIEEFGFAVPESMSPSDEDRSAADLAHAFLELNAETLGFRQHPEAFKLSGISELCDGTRVAIFEQTYGGVPVHTSRIALTLDGQRVSYAELRFIPDVAALPVCQPTVEDPEDLVVAHYYQPETRHTLIVVVVQDNVSSGLFRRVIDACTNETLGYESHLR